MRASTSEYQISIMECAWVHWTSRWHSVNSRWWSFPTEVAGNSPRTYWENHRGSNLIGGIHGRARSERLTATMLLTLFFHTVIMERWYYFTRYSGDFEYRQTSNDGRSKNYDDFPEMWTGIDPENQNPTSLSINTAVETMSPWKAAVALGSEQKPAFQSALRVSPWTFSESVGIWGASAKAVGEWKYSLSRTTSIIRSLSGAN